MNEKESIKEFTKANIGTFTEIKSLEQLDQIPLCGATHVVKEMGNDMIVFTFDNQWYKVPYSNDLYSYIICKNASYNENKEHFTFN